MRTMAKAGRRSLGTALGTARICARGLLRSFRICRGTPHDFLIYGLLRSDWELRHMPYLYGRKRRRSVFTPRNGDR